MLAGLNFMYLNRLARFCLLLFYLTLSVYSLLPLTMFNSLKMRNEPNQEKNEELF